MCCTLRVFLQLSTPPHTCKTFFLLVGTNFGVELLLLPAHLSINRRPSGTIFVSQNKKKANHYEWSAVTLPHSAVSVELFLPKSHFSMFCVETRTGYTEQISGAIYVPWGRLHFYHHPRLFKFALNKRGNFESR